MEYISQLTSKEMGTLENSVTEADPLSESGPKVETASNQFEFIPKFTDVANVASRIQEAKWNGVLGRERVTLGLKKAVVKTTAFAVGTVPLGALIIEDPTTKFGISLVAAGIHDYCLRPMYHSIQGRHESVKDEIEEIKKSYLYAKNRKLFEELYPKVVRKEVFDYDGNLLRRKIDPTTLGEMTLDELKTARTITKVRVFKDRHGMGWL